MAEPVDPPDLPASTPAPELGWWDWIIEAFTWAFTPLYEMWLAMTAVFLLGLAKVFWDISQEVSEVTFLAVQTVLAQLSLSDHIQTAWTAIPAETRNMLAYFRVPEVINNLLSYGITRMILNYVPFI